MSEEKYGIENLKKVISFGVSLSKAIADDVKDKKFSFTEILALLPEFLQVQDFLQHKDDIVNEAKDLSLDEIKQLVSGIEGAIDNAKVSDFIEATLSFVISGKNVIEASKELFGKTDVIPATQTLGTE